MKNLTSFQILMLMGFAVGSFHLDASCREVDGSQQNGRYGNRKKQNHNNQTPKVVIMNEDDKTAMEDIVQQAKDRIEQAMGKNPTEHSIKKFIHATIEEFKKSNKDDAAIDKAIFKLGDAQVAIESFANKLRAVDHHRIASTHINSLQHKLENARRYVKEHAQNILHAQVANNEEEVVVQTERRNEKRTRDDVDDMITESEYNPER